MSNSIWKTPDQKPEENEDIVFIYGSSLITGCYKKNDDTYVEYIGGETFCDNEVERWAYVADIVAQADKAERLQKIAERQNDILQDHFAMLGYSIGKEVMDMYDEINN